MSTPQYNTHPQPHQSTITSPQRRLASPLPSPSTTHTGISNISHLDRGTQIGIIVGITVIAILVVIGCGLGVVGFRRRQRRRRRRLQVARDEELAVLEGEMKTGGAGHKRGQGSAGSGSGLWDNLKIRCGEERGPARGNGRMQRLGMGREGSADVDAESEAGLVKPAPVHLENLPPSSIAVGGAHT